MALFKKSETTKKTGLTESIRRYLDSLGIELQDDMSFMLYMKENDYILYPYISVTELSQQSFALSFKINIKQVEKVTINDLSNINTFNNKSALLTAKLTNTGVLLLEALQIVDKSNVLEVFRSIYESVFTLEKEIDLL